MSTYVVRAVCTKCGATINETPTFGYARALTAVLTNIGMTGILAAGACPTCHYSSLSDINFAVRFPILRDGREITRDELKQDASAEPVEQPA